MIRRYFFTITNSCSWLSSYKKALVANIIDYDTSDDLSDLIGDVGSLTITEDRTPVVNKRTHSDKMKLD